MTTFKDWDNEIDKLGTDEIAKYNQALDTLHKWEFFKKAYDGYGLPVVNSMLSRACQERLSRDERRADDIDPCDICTIGEMLRREKREGDRDLYCETCDSCNQ